MEVEEDEVYLSEVCLVGTAIDDPNIILGPKSTAKRVVRTINFDEFKMNVDSAIVFVGDNAVQETLYLHRRPIASPKFSDCKIIRVSNTTVFIPYNAGWRNYYHTLVQGLFSTWLYKKYFDEANTVYVHPEVSGIRRSLLNRVGVEDKDIIFLNKKENIAANKGAILATTYKSYVERPSPLLRKYALDLAETVDSERITSCRIYISRRDTKNRIIENELLLEKILCKLGFDVVSLSDLAFADQVQIFRSAKMIVAPHGAGLSNIIFCRSDCSVIELTMDQYLNTCFVRIGQTLCLKYVLHISPNKSTETDQRKMRWQVDIDSLVHVIETM